MNDLLLGVVVLGSGFRGRADDRPDIWGERRLIRAVELINSCSSPARCRLIVTGQSVHPHTHSVFSAQAEREAVRLGIPSHEILRASDRCTSRVDTRDDVVQALRLAAANGIRHLMVITESPHWFFRVRYFFESEAPPGSNLLRTEFVPSTPAPWWYWCKEFIGGAVLRFPIIGGYESQLYRVVNRGWRKVAHRFGYVVRL